MGSSHPSVPALEAVVVLIAGIIIKLLVTLAPFQGDNYRRRKLVVVHIDCRYRERPQLFHRLHRHPEAVGGPH